MLNYTPGGIVQGMSSHALSVINLDTPTLGDRSYIAHDGVTAVVVDPQRDIDRVQAILEANNLQLGAVLETHMHNDYVSGGLVLAREHGAKYVTSAEDPVAFDRLAVRDTEVVPVGTFAVQALHTPGHTFTHMSYALLNPAGDAQGVFTGGSMLHGSTGRPDLLGNEFAQELAGLQFGSAHRLAELLEDRVSVHPTHGFGSFCAATSTCGDSSTIADEKVTNPALLLSREEFISQTIAGLDAFPAYYKHMGPANHAGPGPIDLSALRQLSAAEIISAIESGTWVVDLRDRVKWTSAHIPGSYSFGVQGSMATYLGWLYPYERELILVSDSAEEIATAQRELVRIGIDRPAGSFVGDVSADFETTSNKTVSFNDVVDALEDDNIAVFDVRRNSERTASHVAGTRHIPLHELESRIAEVPTDKQIWVHCAGAYRAAAALGILEKAGISAVLINEPYDAALRVAGLTIVEGAADAGPVAPSDVKVAEQV